MTQTAEQKIDEIVKRGGTIVTERRDHVIIERMESMAKIDQYGRVEWTSKIQ